MMSDTTSVIFDAPGPRGRLVGRVVGALGLVVVIGLGAMFVWALRDQVLNWDFWARILEPTTWVDYVIPGALNTLKAALLAVVFAGVFGLIFGVMRLSHLKVFSIPAGIIVEFFRAVPVLILMLFFNAIFVAASLGDIAPFWGVVLGLTLYNGSVIAELVRSGVHSLPKGQSEGGQAVGLTRSQILTAILLPQAITAMLPSLLSQFVVVIKDTALGYIINYPDLLRMIQTLYSSGGTMVGLIFAAACYIVINYTMTLFASWVERRLRSRRAGKSVGTGMVPVAGTANTNGRPDA